jgi:putative membrane protein
MRGWLIHWLLSGVALLIVANILPGIEVESFGSALIAAMVIGFVSATVGLVLKIMLLPFIILSLGLVYLIVNGLMLMLASSLVPGFRVSGLLTAVIGSVLLSIVDAVLQSLAW